jgi:hypothetical protein
MMSREIASEGTDFYALANYLRGELDRLDADERAIHLASSHSFAQWAETALSQVAESLGLTLGFLAGHIVAVYEGMKESFSTGWRKGFDRGRGS